MANTVKRRINIFGKVGKIITTVIIILLLVAEGALLIGAGVVAFLPKDIVSADVSGTADIRFDARYFGVDGSDLTVDAGTGDFAVMGIKANSRLQTKDGNVELTAEVDHLHFNLLDLIKLCVVAAVRLSAVIVALFFFKALMKEFACCDTPFCDPVISKMRRFAIALIPTMIVSSAANTLLGVLFADSFSFGNVDLLPIAFAAVVFVLTAIFRYGAQLQKEHDETV